MATAEPSRQLAGPRPALVVTDLDGTLLDHASHGFSAAAPALGALRARDIPVVLCSSKTRSELEVIQAWLGIEGPMIVENGAAVVLTGTSDLEPLFPDRVGERPARVFGTPYPELRAALARLRERLGGELRGFGDATVEEVAEWTDLSPRAVALAKLRDFDEPFRWHPEPDAALVATATELLSARGLRLTRGGRFWHLTGRNDKGLAVRWLLQAMAGATGRQPRSLGLGDSENDLEMLAAVDEGVVVARPDGTHLEPRPDGVTTTEGIGPAGWREAVFSWLARLEGAASGPETARQKGARHG